MAVLKIGRIGVDVDLDLIQTMRQVNDDKEGRALRLEGILHSTSLAKTNALREQLLGITPGTLVAVTYTKDPKINGFYFFRWADVQASADEVAFNSAGFFKFSCLLQRVGDQTDTMFESRLTGTVATNDHSLVAADALPWVAFPENNLGVWWGQNTVPARVNRVGADGVLKVYLSTTIYALPAPLWSVATSDFYDGAVTVKAGGYTREGTVFPATCSTQWELSNGLVKLTPNATNAGYFNFSGYTTAGDSWETAKVVRVLASDTLSSGVKTWNAVTILRNQPHSATLRFSQSSTAVDRGLFFCDLTLRRGARYAEFRFNTNANSTMGIELVPDATTCLKFGTTWGLEVVTADSNYAMGSARSVAMSTDHAYIKSTTAAKTWDCFIGIVPAGTSAGYDSSTSMYEQYIGGMGESVKAVVR